MPPESLWEYPCGISLFLTQLSYRYGSDRRNVAESCGVPRPPSICGAKNCCPFRGHLVLTGSTLMCWRQPSRNAVRSVQRRKSRLDHRFSLSASQTALRPPWHVWCLNRSTPHNALTSNHIFSSGGKFGPYKLKQLIDLSCQRNMLFRFAGKCYGPLLSWCNIPSVNCCPVGAAPLGCP
jgi:hypothetical protein